MRQKALRGGAWVGGAVMVDRFLRLLRNIILARILLPEAFGTMAIVLAVYQAFESFTDLGISKVIIQNPKGDTREYLNSAWWLSFGRTLLLYAVVFFIAPFIARFYHMPDLTSLIRLVFASAICKGCWSPAVFAANKHLRFGRWAFLTQGSGFAGIVLSVTLALSLKSVWALAIALVFENILSCILSFILFPFVPQVKFDRTVVAEFSRFGRGFAGLPILTFIFMRADVFFLGRMRSQEELGIYSMAASLAVVPFEALTSILNQIGLSAFSKKQSDNDWTGRSILLLTAVVVTLGFPLLAGILLCGKQLLCIIYGERYAVCASAFVLLFASNLLKTAGLPIIQVYLSRGMPKLHRAFSGLRALLLLLLLFPAIYYWGLTGAAIASVCAMAIPYLVQMKGVHAITGLQYRPYLAVYFRGLMLSIPPLVFGVVVIVLSDISSWILLAAAGSGITVSWIIGGKSLLGRYKRYQQRSPSMAEVSASPVHPT